MRKNGWTRQLLFLGVVALLLLCASASKAQGWGNEDGGRWCWEDVGPIATYYEFWYAIAPTAQWRTCQRVEVTRAQACFDHTLDPPQAIDEDNNGIQDCCYYYPYPQDEGRLHFTVFAMDSRGIYPPNSSRGDLNAIDDGVCPVPPPAPEP